MTTVELCAATKAFPAAVVNVNLRASSGGQLVLLGPSGCGKTTVLRMIAGLVELDSGDVLFDEQSVRAVKPERRDAAMVFQDHALFPFRTVAENVEYGLKIRKVPEAERRRRVTDALAAVQLHGFEDRWPDELSGGQRQRVAIARAIVVEPRVLLLDEPFSSLDPVLRTELQQTVRIVQQDRNITSVFVTHDREEARAIGDEVAVMLDGQVRQVGPPATIFAHPVDADVARFVGSAS